MALRCLCELLVGLPHFNFRNNILAVVVPRMTSKTLAGKVCLSCGENMLRLRVYVIISLVGSSALL